MADLKISQLPAATAADPTDEYVINKAGASKKIAQSVITAYLQNLLTDTSGVTASGITHLNIGQNYIDVVFDVPQPDTSWILIGSAVLNTVDVSPENIWPGVISSKTTDGFRIFLNGNPETNNYYLHWAISGFVPRPFTATSYYMNGPVTGFVGVASVYTVHLPAAGTVTGTVTVTPSDSSGGGAFSPTSVGLTTASPSATFSYTPGSTGTKAISVTNNGGLTNPANINLAVQPPVATSYTMTGPTSGYTGVASSPFTVTLSPSGGSVTGVVHITPSAGAGGGTFTPVNVGLSTATPSATFTYTAGADGAKTISATNDGSLTNPSTLAYTASPAPLADGSLISTWLDSSTAHNNATQTGSARPIYKTNIVNGKPVVRFDPANSTFLNLTATMPDSPYTVLGVMKGWSGAYLIGLSTKTAGTLTPFAPYGHSSGARGYGIAGSFVLGSTYDDHAFHVLSVVGNSGNIYVDGVGDGVGVNATGAIGVFEAIGRSPINYCTGDIAEIMIYNVYLTTADQNKIDKYLGAKYGITVAGASTAADPSTISGLVGWWKADSL